MKTLNPQKSEELWNEIKNIEYLISKLGGFNVFILISFPSNFIYFLS